MIVIKCDGYKECKEEYVAYSDSFTPQGWAKGVLMLTKTNGTILRQSVHYCKACSGRLKFLTDETTWAEDLVEIITEIAQEAANDAVEGR